MRMAIASLTKTPEMVLVDGFNVPSLTLPQKAVIKGDSLCKTIGAASIIAKVTRDRIMRLLHDEYPSYGWIKNKGYGTTEHYEAITRYGTTPFHRKTFTLCHQRQLFDILRG